MASRLKLSFWDFRLRIAKRVLAVLMFATAVFAGSDLHADNAFWTPQGDSDDWFISDNWITGRIPNLTDRVIQNRALHPITLGHGSSTAVTGELLLTGGGQLRTGGNTLLVDKTGDSSFTTVEANGVLTIDAGGVAGRAADVDNLGVGSLAELRMNGGTLEVDRKMTLSSSGSIAGHGVIKFTDEDAFNAADVFDSTGTIRANGGTLRFEAKTDARFDLGFASQATLLDSSTGNLEFDADLGFGIRGNLLVGAGHRADFAQKADFSPESSITLSGGSAAQPAILQLNTASQIEGSVELNGFSSVLGHARFADSDLQINGTATLSGRPRLSESTLVMLPNVDDRLHFEGVSRVFGTPSDETAAPLKFAGSGKVINNELSEIQLVNAPRVGVGFENSGVMDVLGLQLFTVDIGSAEFEDFTQTSSGVMKYHISSIEGLDGDTTALHDVYSIEGEAVLDGALDVSVVRLFTHPLLQPEVGDSFEILSAAGGITGEFSNTNFPLAPIGTEWQLEYLDTSVMLNLVDLPGLTGDFDMDGDVDIDDIDFYSGNIGLEAVGDLAKLDLDNDGFITLSDHDQHVTNYVETSNGEIGTLLGDINLDGQVDVLGDAFALVGNLGSSSATSWSMGDLNADGNVDVLGDAFRLVGNLGQNNGSASSFKTAAVPESNCIGLIAIAFLTAPLCRWK